MKVKINNKFNVKLAIKFFNAFILFFYIAWAMFHDESSLPAPLKIETIIFMIGIAVLCNIGFYLALSNYFKQFKKTILSLILMSAFLNFFMFVSIFHNPFLFINDYVWIFLRKVLAYGAIAFSFIIFTILLRDKNDLG